MKYQVDIPNEVDERLAACASQAGADVVQLIQQAVVHFVEEHGRFVDEHGTPASNGDGWSQEVDDRRCQLIDKDIAGTIAGSERVELARLQQLANEHFVQVAPPPIDGACQLHRQLSNCSASDQ